jgi:pyruvate,water dikinase
MASLFTNRALAYREAQGFDHFSVGLSIGIQKMVRADKASSGVVFSIDTESGCDKIAFVTASWGLGENIVQGWVFQAPLAMILVYSLAVYFFLL